MTDDYLRYYDLQSYLFQDVREHFLRQGQLDAFDLFSIIMWKANRSKSTLARRRANRRISNVAHHFAAGDCRCGSTSSLRSLTRTSVGPPAWSCSAKTPRLAPSPSVRSTQVWPL